MNVCRTSSCYSSLVADDGLPDLERFFTLLVSLKHSVVFNTVNLLIRRFGYVSLNNRQQSTIVCYHPRIIRIVILSRSDNSLAIFKTFNF